MAMKVFIMKKMQSLEWSEWKFCAQNVMPTLAMFLTMAHLQQGNDIVWMVYLYLSNQNKLVLFIIKGFQKKIVYFMNHLCDSNQK